MLHDPFNMKNQTSMKTVITLNLRKKQHFVLFNVFFIEPQKHETGKTKMLDF